MRDISALNQLISHNAETGMPNLRLTASVPHYAESGSVAQRDGSAEPAPGHPCHQRLVVWFPIPPFGWLILLDTFNGAYAVVNKAAPKRHGSSLWSRWASVASRVSVHLLSARWYSFSRKPESPKARKPESPKARKPESPKAFMDVIVAYLRICVSGWLYEAMAFKNAGRPL